MNVKRSDVSEEEILAACRRFHAGMTTLTPEQALPYPPKVVLAKMAQMLDAGIIDCGVSLQTAWEVSKR